MRPVDVLFKDGVGAVGVTLNGINSSVSCRNGMTGKNSVFFTDEETAMAISNWIAIGKTGLIQEIVPTLSPELREMCISGISPGEWDEMCKEDEE